MSRETRLLGALINNLILQLRILASCSFQRTPSLLVVNTTLLKFIALLLSYELKILSRWEISVCRVFKGMMKDNKKQIM